MEIGAFRPTLSKSAGGRTVRRTLLRIGLTLTLVLIGVKSQTSRAESREVPVPLPEHPGNVFLEGENVRVPWPQLVPPQEVLAALATPVL